MTDRDILQDYNEAYREAVGEWNPWLAEAYTDMGFMTGNQWNDADKEFLTMEHRNAYVYNNIHRIIKQISGYQRKNRLSSIVEPRETNDVSVAETMSDLLLYVLQSQEGYNKISDCFEGALVTGMNLVSLWMDYSKDPVNGDIMIGREPFNSFLLDPRFTQIDLTDCNYLLRRRYVNDGQAKSLLPGHDKDIEELYTRGGGARDDKFSYMAYSMRNNGQKLMRYDEFWRRTTQKRYLVIDNMTGQTKKWNGSKASLDLFRKQYPFIDYKKIYEPDVELVIMLEEQVMYKGADPYGLHDYPFVPTIGYYMPEYDNMQYKLRGVVRGLRDAQEETNKLRSKASDIINSQINSGWEIEEGQVNNPDDLYRTGQGIVIERKKGSPPLQRIQPAELSQAFPVMLEMLQRDLLQLAGSSEELLGVAEGGNTEVSGTLAKQRSGNALTTFQGLFDNLSLMQKITSEKILKLMAANWTPEKVMRITGKQIPEEYSVDDLDDYDIVVKESLLTDTQKNLAYLQALEAKRLGIAIPDKFILSMMPIANKDELMQAYEEEAQVAQQQQAKIAQQEELALRLGNAEVAQRLSLAKEREARAKADIGLLIERTSESKQNQSEAVLNQVKAATEVAGIRQDQLIQALQFVSTLQQQAEQSDKQREIMSSAVAEQPSQGA